MYNEDYRNKKIHLSFKVKFWIGERQCIFFGKLNVSNDCLKYAQCEGLTWITELEYLNFCGLSEV